MTANQRGSRCPESNGELILHPVETPAGSGWIGLAGKAVSWLSIGPLDQQTVERYWRGKVVRGSSCPLSEQQLAAAARDGTSIELAPLGTDFQMRVWKHLLTIPFGSTRSYGEIAGELGAPSKARAVGAAVAANPVAWVIPCHRVVPARGGLGSYRWGAPAKERLLAWERSMETPPGDAEAARRRKLETMLLRAQRFEDIAKLAGDIAHDLNNLLAPIRMATQLLKRKLEDVTLDRYVDIIETSTGRARSVIQEILAFSRETEPENGDPIDIRPLLKELEKMVRETFPERIELEFQHASEPPPLAMDPTQFHRAILNILVNARDAIKGSGRILVKVSTHDLEMQVRVGNRMLLPGKFVCVSISDTGCGISEEIREQIFDPFFTTKPKDKGTGLGLASVYGIVARAGGFIDLESTVGKGSTFHIFLPRALPAD